MTGQRHEETLLSQKVVAARLGISRPTLLRLRRRGEIAYFKIGARILYSEETVREFLSTVKERQQTQGGKKRTRRAKK
jgi:excisionase family DNA binding protein